MQLSKVFIDSDKFTNIANIEIPFKTYKTLLALLIKLKIPLEANEELDYKQINFKLSAKTLTTTAQLFSRTLLDYIIYFHNLNGTILPQRQILFNILSEDFFPPQCVSFKNGLSAATITVKLLIPFFVLEPQLRWDTGFPFKYDLNLEISTVFSKQCEYQIYALFREYLGETAFITLQKLPKKVLPEIQAELRNVNTLIYNTEGQITGNENCDIYDLYLNEEIYQNVFTEIIAIHPPINGSAATQYYSKIVLLKRDVRVVINCNTSIEEDRYFLYTMISNSQNFIPTHHDLTRILPIQFSR